MTKKVTPEQAQRRLDGIIRRSNTRFKNATAAQKRVMVARDVIQRLKSGQYTAITGTYVRLDYRYSKTGHFMLPIGLKNYPALTDNTQLSYVDTPIQPLLVGGIHCHVCAVGSLFVSCNAVVDSGKSIAEFHTDANDYASMASGIFPKKMRDKLECYFEGYRETGMLNESDDCETFKKAHESNKRLLLLMQNIVKNKGEFVPAQLKPR